MRTIAVPTSLPPEVVAMLSDFRAMSNHLIAHAHHHHLDSAFDLRERNYAWFRQNYEGRYAIHYLHSAASFAAQHAKSWRKLGGDTTRLPHVESPIARLDQMLVKTKVKEENHLVLQLTLAPRQWVLLDLRVHHKHWAEWSVSRMGELVIVPDGVRLTFQYDDVHTVGKGFAAVDLNFDRAVMATSDGEVTEVSLKDAMEVQKHHRWKRHAVQRHTSHNAGKQQKLLHRDRGREHDRVDKLVHDHAKEIGGAAGGKRLVMEDLSSTTRECLKDSDGRTFRAKLSSWPHGGLQRVLSYRYPHGTKEVYARGSSTFCPFCGARVVHPTWKTSRCGGCGLSYDRDALAAVNLLVRGMVKHEAGTPWALARDAMAASVVDRLVRQCTLQSSPNGEWPEGGDPLGQDPPAIPEPYEVPGEEKGLRGVSPATPPSEQGTVRPEREGPSPGARKSDSGPVPERHGAERNNRHDARGRDPSAPVREGTRRCPRSTEGWRTWRGHVFPASGERSRISVLREGSATAWSRGLNRRSCKVGVRPRSRARP
ncbi:MAG: transposase [Euryarchaeota archaeon]|nr:transposase [Euryarchaeota archaeon]